MKTIHLHLLPMGGELTEIRIHKDVPAIPDPAIFHDDARTLHQALYYALPIKTWDALVARLTSDSEDLD
jgi:hypothetical protein